MTEASREPDRSRAWAAYNAAKRPPTLNPEQTIVWLESMRELMREVWKNNPKWRESWEKERFGPRAPKRA